MFGGNGGVDIHQFLRQIRKPTSESMSLLSFFPGIASAELQEETKQTHTHSNQHLLECLPSWY